ncbi:MAG: hypothetical protein GWM87_07810 [Xanthomonadales bacterium]|nr:hypothetical protein [Xanthomonadales bacterium]NIX12849.1 hypothetical protein [Xanthomonadales bacterium]
MTGRGHPPNSRGAALLICLLLLTALTLLGLAAASDMTLQHRMAGNIESARESLRNAEAGLLWAERWLLSLSGDARPASCAANCAPGDVIRAENVYPPSPAVFDENWWAIHGIAAGVEPELGILDPDLYDLGSHWLVEEVHHATQTTTPDHPGEVSYYRITARGSEAGGAGVSIVQGILARPWGDPKWTDPLPPGFGQRNLCHRFGIAPPCGRVAWRQLR